MWVIYVRWCYMIILFCLDEYHDFLVLPIQLSQLSGMHFNKWWIQVLIKFLFCFVWFFHWTSFIFYDCTSTSLSTIWFCLLVMFMKFNTNARFKYSLLLIAWNSRNSRIASNASRRDAYFYWDVCWKCWIVKTLSKTYTW
jgi:hypothetical protein